MIDESMFYDLNKVLSYNCLFNLILGARGLGKTYSAKDWTIRDFLKTQAQFLYVRRYDTELKEVNRNNRFWKDISGKYPDHQFTISKNAYMIDGVTAGQCIPLSTSKIMKSVPFPDINKIIFDEFIIDRGTYHYLPDEVTCFLELYETIARLRDNVRVLFLSNAVTQVNPYFLYFNIKLPNNKSGIYRQGDILLHLAESKDFSEYKKLTRFGKLIAGTKYANYAIDNEFLRDTDTFIQKKTGNAKFQFAFIYQGNTIGIWYDWQGGRVYASYDRDPSNPIKFALTLADHSENTMLIKRLSSVESVRSFIEFYKQGLCCFEDMKIKGLVYEIIRLIMI